MRKTLFLIRILPVVSSHCSRQETAVNCSYITLPRPGLWWSSPIQPWTWLLLFWYTYYRSRSPALTFGWILSINIFAVLSLYINEWNGNFYYLFNLTLHDFTKIYLSLFQTILQFSQSIKGLREPNPYELELRAASCVFINNSVQTQRGKWCSVSSCNYDL